MRTITKLFALLCLLALPALAGGSLELFLSDVNLKAKADLGAFKTTVSLQFGVSNSAVTTILKKVDKPEDAFMVFQLCDMSKKKPEEVIKVYDKEKKGGWGQIAKSVGIKPGSAEFHALKNGDLHYGTKSGDKGKSNGKDKNKGNGKNK